ncbi:hypothetical protein GCM10010124_25570 [Pilimelia terevasa]|uniref:Uncharacterized protein n=1 Tax=Pilimelia terevasa TaxID=53372 RepID=A0A8J3BNE3_9ACTN|nr:hypothetical protein GCM10010124_25570 [Pilimelia terevasa]
MRDAGVSTNRETTLVGPGHEPANQLKGWHESDTPWFRETPASRSTPLDRFDVTDSRRYYGTGK